MKLPVCVPGKVLLAAAVVSALMACTATAWSSEPYFVRGGHGKQQVLDQDLDLRAGGTLRVLVGDINLHLKAGGSGPAHIDVFVSGPDVDKAVEYYEEKVRMSIESHDGVLTIESRERRDHSHWFFDGLRRVNVWAVVTVPTELNTDIRTVDGDVLIDELNGKLEIETTDGDIRAGKLLGNSLVLESTDGDVEVRSIDSDDVELSTTDGDLQVKTLSAKRVTVSSTDGDISLPQMEADEITLKCSDGDVDVAARGGVLTATCGDGDLDVELLDSMEVNLRSRDGDISLVVPRSLGADLDMRGDDISLRGGIKVKGSVSDRRVVGSINDGGPLVKVKTSDGDIRLHLR
jgi:DUF4097 and DUF4098 domain-containing protein YvlB